MSTFHFWKTISSLSQSLEVVLLCTSMDFQYMLLKESWRCQAEGTGLFPSSLPLLSAEIASQSIIVWMNNSYQQIDSIHYPWIYWNWVCYSNSRCGSVSRKMSQYLEWKRLVSLSTSFENKCSQRIHHPSGDSTFEMYHVKPDTIQWHSFWINSKMINTKVWFVTVIFVMRFCVQVWVFSTLFVLPSLLCCIPEPGVLPILHHFTFMIVILYPSPRFALTHQEQMIFPFPLEVLGQCIQHFDIMQVKYMHLWVLLCGNANSLFFCWIKSWKLW
jgi:hypothetical protein